jgi:hypothetical protein
MVCTAPLENVAGVELGSAGEYGKRKSEGAAAGFSRQ